jgi:predicted DNA-binding transcriptional regulator YafY
MGIRAGWLTKGAEAWPKVKLAKGFSFGEARHFAERLVHTHTASGSADPRTNSGTTFLPLRNESATMPRNFARHEQFLRIFALLEILAAARQPLDDQALTAALKERLGLMRLSPRTLRRDCDFLCSCGYPVDHKPLPDGRRYGWILAKDSVNGRKIPSEPLTLLELVAFTVSRDLLKPFEGTVLWTGIESLRHKLEREMPAAMRERLDSAKNVFHVKGFDPRYAARPRLISTLSGAITDCREIEIEEDGDPATKLRLQPHRIVIEPPLVSLLAYPADSKADGVPVLLNIERIRKVTPLDTTFTPRDVRPEDFLT